MTSADSLSRQNIEGYERRLRHIDEMMTHARRAAAEGRTPAKTDELLEQIEADRARLKRDIADLAHWPPVEKASSASREAGIGATLQKIGTELEKALATIIEHGPR